MPRPPRLRIKPDWTQRHRKWAIALPVLAIVTFIGALAFGVLHLLKSSAPYRDGLALAQSSPAALAVLGQPIEPAIYLTGTIKVSDHTGRANLSIPLHGSKASGTLVIVATRSADQWHIDRLFLTLRETDRRIDLLQSSPKASDVAPPQEIKLSVPLLP